MCFSFWGVFRGDSRLTNQSATSLVNLRSISISPGKTPKAKTHSVHFWSTKFLVDFFSPIFCYEKCVGSRNYRFEEKSCAINHFTSQIYKFWIHIDSITTFLNAKIDKLIKQRKIS
jgi:hypothetical protein